MRVRKVVVGRLLGIALSYRILSQPNLVHPSN